MNTDQTEGQDDDDWAFDSGVDELDGEATRRTCGSDSDGEQPILVEAQLLKKLSDVTSNIQFQISKKLVENENYRQFFDNLPSSENAVLELIDDAVSKLVKLMPLASMHNINVFMSLLSVHSSVTGDPTIARMIAELNKEFLADTE